MSNANAVTTYVLLVGVAWSLTFRPITLLKPVYHDYCLEQSRRYYTANLQHK